MHMLDNTSRNCMKYHEKLPNCHQEIYLIATMKIYLVATIKTNRFGAKIKPP
jgi:hypothetical protein